MTLSQKFDAVRTWYATYLGRVYADPAKQDDIKGWVAQIDNDGNNIDAIQQAFIASAQKDPEWRLGKVIAGPPGPAGPPGSTVDTAQFAAKDHPHIATTTIK